VKAALGGIEGTASAERGARDAADALERAQAELDAFYEFADVLEPAARRRATALTEKRDEAREHLDRLGGLRAVRTVTASADWDDLTLDERRALIRATVSRAVVHPGRGPERVTVELFGE
jgi:hypothetical protein